MTPLEAPELAELYERTLGIIEERLLPAMTRANRAGELEALLRLLGVEDLLGDDGAVDLRPKRVLVLGNSEVKVQKLRSIVHHAGGSPSLFDFALGYSELKHYNFASLRGSDKYQAILVGPLPHSTPGKLDSSSAVAEMESHPDLYPPVYRLFDSTGLKITNNSFRRAVEELLAATQRINAHSSHL